MIDSKDPTHLFLVTVFSYSCYPLIALSYMMYVIFLRSLRRYDDTVNAGKRR
jgi:hypothetical protein